MRTIKEFFDNKYAKNQMGKDNFDTAVSEISQHIITKHTAQDGLDKSFVDAVRGVVSDGNALAIEEAMGVTSLGAAVLGGGAVALGSEDTMLQSLALAGVTAAGVMLVGYITDKIRYNKSKSQLKNWVQDEIAADDYVIPEMSGRTKSACLGEVCENLVDEFVMEMK